MLFLNAPAMFRLALATTKAEFDQELSSDTECSHLCHWTFCCNPNHSIQESGFANRARHACRRYLKTLLDDSMRIGAHINISAIAKQVRENYQHGNSNLQHRCFPEGLGMLLPTETEIHARESAVVHAAMTELAGMCATHKLDFPLSLVHRDARVKYQRDLEQTVFVSSESPENMPILSPIAWMMREVWRPMRVFAPYINHYVSHHQHEEQFSALEDSKLEFDGDEECRKVGCKAMAKGLGSITTRTMLHKYSLGDREFFM